MEKLIRLALIAWSEMRLVERFGPKMAAAITCAAFAFFAILAASGLAAMAMWLSIDASSGPVAASLWSALVFLLIAAALLITMKMVLNSSHAPRTPRAGLAQGAAPLSDDVMALLSKAMGNTKVASLISAVVAGLMAGTQRR